LYVLRWEASENDFLKNLILEHTGKNGLDKEFEEAETWSDLFSWKTISGTMGVTSDLISKGKKTFLESRNRAKKTGIMLAHFLASDNSIFKN